MSSYMEYFIITPNMEKGCSTCQGRTYILATMWITYLCHTMAHSYGIRILLLRTLPIAFAEEYPSHEYHQDDLTSCINGKVFSSLVISSRRLVYCPNLLSLFFDCPDMCEESSIFILYNLTYIS